MSISRKIAMTGAFVCFLFGINAVYGEERLSGSDQSSCGPHRATILDLADRIISERPRVKRFSQRHFGTAATYLKLRYDDLGMAAGLELLDHVQAGTQRQAQGLTNVRLAFAISKSGVEEGLKADDRPAVEIFADFSPVVMRQILLADAGATFFELLTAVRNSPDLVKGFEARYFSGLGVHNWVVDQSDDFKLTLARNAEGAGELGVAAMVLGSRQELPEYDALLERHQEEDLAKLAGPDKLTTYLASIYNQNAPVPVPGDDDERRQRRVHYHEILRASSQMGGMAWLSILFNQTGAEGPIAGVSRDFLAEIEAARLQPRAELEPAWVYLYGLLSDDLGNENLRQQMASFSLGKTVRHYADTAQTTLNWMIARQAMVPYLTETDTGLPSRPSVLPPDFDWEAWMAAASAVQSGKDDLPLGVDRTIYLELLLAKGDVTQALELANKFLPPTDRLWFYRDVMIRLDQLCDGYTVYPGAELSMGGDILYRFAGE
ncbi:hypothetical protein [uncultured Roseibium sp.]|uniref:hypothetical protein n=1 Tax=uncultured Roseibium sp. TaxID=1936171 RepID=UPI0026270261|nr:hypothetical protein [uncultured Roseibium sp.]